MKHLPALLLVLLLLCGCAQEAPAAETTLPATESTAGPAASPEGLYDTGSRLEASTNGAVRAYPLNLPMVSGMCAFGDGLLVFSGEEATTLTLLTGDALFVTASVQLDFFLDDSDPSLQIHGSQLSYFDPVKRETVVLDSSLREVSHITAPEDLTGTPVLSGDRNTLFYCTADSLRAWDLESGIRRTLKEMAFAQQTVVGVHHNDTVVQCQTGESRLFIAADTGRLVYERDGDLALTSVADRYYAAFSLGFRQAAVFGQDDAPQILLPRELSAQCFFLPERHAAAAVSIPAEGELSLEYYDLNSGMRTSALTLESEHCPVGFAAGSEGFVYILIYDAGYGCDTVYRWDTRQTAVSDDTDYTGSYSTADAPDAKGLAQCQAYADEIGAKHGIEILIGEDAVAVQPWDYDLGMEPVAPILMRELTLLDQRLGHYPEGMLAATASNFTALKLCLVRSVTGSAESGSLGAATGVQFLDGTDAYVVITLGMYAEQALYHELFHVMETHIFNYSIAFDQWDTLNPAGFSYDYGYAANEGRDSGIYLQPENRAFVDTYSMSFPKEDRARIMEYAMLDGNKAVFEPKIMQAKLQALCDGIREAYGLEKAEETFLWEQYLR